MPDARVAARQALPDQPLDEEVVRRVLAGEVALFEVLVRRNNSRLYRALRGFVSDETEVEELMQQTYLLAYSRLAQFTHDARFSTWLIRIGINEALQKVRRERKWKLVDVSDPAQESDLMKSSSQDSGTPEDRTGAREAVRLMELVLDQMPELYRVAFMLREVEGLSTAETADALALTEDAVKQRLLRARQLLKDGMEARMGESLAEVFPFHARRCDRVVAGVMTAIAQRGQ